MPAVVDDLRDLIADQREILGEANVDVWRSPDLLAQLLADSEPDGASGIMRSLLDDDKDRPVASTLERLQLASRFITLPNVATDEGCRRLEFAIAEARRLLGRSCAAADVAERQLRSHRSGG